MAELIVACVFTIYLTLMLFIIYKICLHSKATLHI